MDRLRELAGRLGESLSAFFDAFVRENRVLPPVAALLALFLFAWVVAGAFLNEPVENGTSGQADLVQSRDPSGAAPQVEDRDADSYAAYRNKDPFRQLLAPAESTAEETNDGTSTPDGGTEDTTGETTASPPPGGAGAPGGNPQAGTPGGGAGAGGGGAGATTRNDSDGDGITNRREEKLGLDPRNPDSDGDGTLDGQEGGGGAGGGGAGAGGAGGAGGGGAGAGTGGDAGAGGAGGAGAGGGGTDDELFDSGGGYAP